MKYYTLIFFTSFFILSACTNSESVKSKVEQTAVKNSSTPVENLSSIPVAIMQKLFDECNHVDYLFYSTNFSMSMDNQGSIQSTLTHVSEKVPVLNKPCKGMGRIFYEIDGNIEMEAEIYFSKDCQYFVFMKDNKRLYANNITADGVAHFNNIFKQASQIGK